LIKTNIIQDLF